MATQQPLKRSRSPSPARTQKRCRLDSTDPTIPIKFLVLSDTHSAEVPDLTRSAAQCHVLLHCGDLTGDGSPSSLENALDNLAKTDAELKLFIAGNHDISLDRDYYLGEGGSEAACSSARQVISKCEASGRGMHFLEEGTHTFTLKSGATFTIYASPYTPKYGASAFQYPSEEDRFGFEEDTPEWARNVATEKSLIPEGIDIVMSHGPSKYLLDGTMDGGSASCEHLRRAIART